MGQTPDSTERDPIHTARPLTVGIPFARPVAPLPGRSGVTRGGDELLLLASTARDAWVDIAQLIAFLILFELVVGFVIGVGAGVVFKLKGLSADAAGHEMQRILLLPMLTLRALASVAIVVAVLRRRRQAGASVGLRRGGLGLDIPVGFLAAAVVYGVILLTTPALWLFWPDLPQLMEENSRRIMSMVPKLRPSGFVAVAVMVGIYEELVFRGFLMTRLRRGIGSWTPAVLISTAMFTALHAIDQTGPALVWITALSIVFSVVVIWRRSIVPAIIGHALFDTSQFLLLYVQAGDSWT